MAAPDPGQEFVIAHFSGSGHRLSVINPPPVVTDTLAANLQSVMPHIISADHSDEDALVIEQKTMNYRGRGKTSVHRNVSWLTIN